MMDIENYNEVKDCIYKEEYYSVRDNGAILRHCREGKPKRRTDEKWSFGKSDIKTNYLLFCGERVHRIVATAFHGPAPSEQYVVDHIDTNRQNNRPENLRWLTRLENALSNPITRKKIELICGSIEAFLANPSLLYGYEKEYNNFSWMRKVSKEEAQNSLERWRHWANTASPNPNYKKAESNIGNWIFEKRFDTEIPRSTDSFINTFAEVKPATMPNLENNDFNYKIEESNTIDTEERLARTTDIKKEESEEDLFEDLPDSLTPSAKQNWKTPTKFPCCPAEVTENGLQVYWENLKEGEVFSSNDMNTLRVMNRGFSPDDKDVLHVLSTQDTDEYPVYNLTCVIIKNNKFIHINRRFFTEKDVAIRYFRLFIGEEEWTEDDWYFMFEY